MDSKPVPSAAEQRLLDMMAEVNKSLADQFAEELATVKASLGGIQSSIAKKITQPGGTEQRGLTAASLIRCVAAAKKNQTSVEAQVRAQYGEDSPVMRALEASNNETGGFLIPGDFASEVIELLRAQSVVEQSNPRRVPLDRGTLTLPKQTSGTSGSWIGEGQNITKTGLTVGQITLTAKKYGALVPISNDLLRFATADVDAMVRDDLVRSIQLAEDLAFLRGDGTGAAPKGLRYRAGNSLSANATVNLANITEDLGEAMQLLMDDNVGMTRLKWHFSPRTWRYLATVRDGNGNLVFFPEMRSGTLFTIPFSITTQIPSNLGSGANESEIYLVDYDTVVVGRASRIEIDASADAAYHDGSAVQAAFSLDQTVVRAITQVDLAVRHSEAVCIIDTVKWGV